MKQVKNKVSGIKDITVDSFKEVDIEGLIIPNIVMYKGPDDYKDKYIARIFALTKPTNTIIIRETAEELEKDIKESFDVEFYVEREDFDDEPIIGTWFL